MQCADAPDHQPVLVSDPVGTVERVLRLGQIVQPGGSGESQVGPSRPEPVRFTDHELGVDRDAKRSEHLILSQSRHGGEQLPVEPPSEDRRDLHHVSGIGG